MIRLLAILALALTTAAEPISPRLAGDIADAIHQAEGGRKARVPYGVLSVRVQDAEHAREIALASIRANWRRWEAAGRPGPFIPYMARRWVPRAHDPRGHRAWVRNVTILLRESNLRAARR
jgi:hypothetical protein